MITKIGPWVMGKYIYSALVTNVVNGDTIDLEIDLGFSVSFNVRVKLIGIDAYETRISRRTGPVEKKIGLMAKAFVKGAVEGRYVQVETSKRERRDGYVATVRYMKDGCSNMTNLSSELVRLKYAIFKTDYKE